MRFSSIIGLDTVKKHLIQSVSGGHVAHAQMFFGLHGSANLAMALAYATYLNCENPSSEDSCGECPSCKKIDKLVHPDMHFVFPIHSLGTSGEGESADRKYDEERSKVVANFREAVLQNQAYFDLNMWVSQLNLGNKQCLINVREGRGIIRSITLKAFEAKYKVVLIWLSELMNLECANAILKVLEEPPARTIFLLVTNDVEKNISTIVSRTQIVKIPSHSDEEIIQFLVENKDISEEKATEMAIFSEGSIIRSYEFLENSNVLLKQFFKEWLRSCYMFKYADYIAKADDFFGFSKQDQKNFFTYGLLVIRDLNLYYSDAPELIRIPEDEKQFLQGLSKTIAVEKLTVIMEMFNNSFYYLERNAHSKIMFMQLSFQMSTLFTRKK